MAVLSSAEDLRQERELECLFHPPLLAALVIFCGWREASRQQGEGEKKTGGGESEGREGVTRGRGRGMGVQSLNSN